MDDLRDFSKVILARCSQYHLNNLSIRVLTLALLPLNPLQRARVPGAKGLCLPQVHLFSPRPHWRIPGPWNSLLK